MPIGLLPAPSPGQADHVYAAHRGLPVGAIRQQPPGCTSLLTMTILRSGLARTIAVLVLAGRAPYLTIHPSCAQVSLVKTCRARHEYSEATAAQKLSPGRLLLASQAELGGAMLK